MRLNDLMADWMPRRFGGFHPMTGGNRPAMPSPMTGGQMQGGYDSSGINPGGMYTGGQTGNFPANPGGFAPMGGQFPPQPMTGGPLQAQSGYPQGLAGLLGGFRRPNWRRY